jgi:membrane protein implicated in regulation of membrane protease activity
MSDQDIASGFIINLVLALIPAIVAKRKGYPFFGWWLLGVLFSAVIILLIAIFMRRRLPRSVD